MKRKKFIEHVGWIGLGILWVVGENGLLTACKVGDSQKQKLSNSALSFVQISDTHIGFDKPANTHVKETLTKAINAINSLPTPPTFVVHTGDITHLSKPAEFDFAKQILSQLKAPLFTLPGEQLPSPGKGEKPAPVKLSENDLLAVLGFRTIEFVPKNDIKIDQHSLA